MRDGTPARYTRPVPISSGSRRFLASVALALLPALALLLWACDFFAAWDGRAVSVRPGDGSSITRAVLIAHDDGAFERHWPSALVQDLRLPVDPLAIAPKPIPSERPATRKQRWTLSFEVDAPDGPRTVPTTSPRALGLAVLVWLGLVAVRNMFVGGAPWVIEPRDRYAIPVQSPAGQAAPPSGRGSRSRFGPPPPRPVRGRGRR